MPRRAPGHPRRLPALDDGKGPTQHLPMSEILVGEGYLSREPGPRLFYRTWRGSAERGRVVLVHGLGEHSGRYDEFGRFLAGRGFPTLAFDLRGFGKSEGTRGHIDSWSDYLSDLELALSAESFATSRQTFLVAHSMGGLVAFDYLAQRSSRLSGIVATSPLCGVAARVPAWKDSLGRVAARLVPRLTMRTGIGPELLTHDPGKIREYNADRLICEKATARWYVEMRSALERIHANAHRITIPFLVVHAGADRVTDPEASRRFLELVPSADKEFRLRPGCYHEVLNETDREALFDEIARWLETRSALVATP